MHVFVSVCVSVCISFSLSVSLCLCLHECEAGEQSLVQRWALGALTIRSCGVTLCNPFGFAECRRWT